MARVAGVDLPRGKRTDIALTAIYGIGRVAAAKICEMADLDGGKRNDLLTDQEVARIRDVIDNNFKVEGDLRREISLHVKRLMDLKTYRGIRHRRGLPLRGQRTHTNARTRKGPRRAAVKKK
jgi:small subunit ribosomal protein S13